MNCQKKLLLVLAVGSSGSSSGGSSGNEVTRGNTGISKDSLRNALSNLSPIQEARRSTDTETIEFSDGSTQTVPRQRWKDNSTGKIYNSLDAYLQAYNQ